MFWWFLLVIVILVSAKELCRGCGKSISRKLTCVAVALESLLTSSCGTNIEAVTRLSQYLQTNNVLLLEVCMGA